MHIKEKNKKLNISFDNDNDNNIQLWKDIYGTHVKVGESIFGDFPDVTKIEDYFYEMTIDDVDEEFAYNLIDNPYAIKGACSQFKKGIQVGRSYDWYYSNDCEFLIHNKAKNGRFASIGISAVQIPNKSITDKTYSELFKLIPFHMLDGINSEGVYCGTNVVPNGDKGKTIGTNPDGKNLPCIFIPRFVLDKAKSARHAIDLLKSRNIYATKYYGSIIELHVLIADVNSTYIIEFIDNKMHVMSDQDDEFDNLPNDKAIMTNFYLNGWNGELKAGYTGDTEEEIKDAGLTAHAQGLERYKILLDGIDSVTNALDLIKDVKYSNAYDEDIDPFWYSEFTDVIPEVNLFSTEEEFQPIKEVAIEYFENKNRDEAIVWQSVHQVEYNLENKSLSVIVQEGNSTHEYSLEDN